MERDSNKHEQLRKSVFDDSEMRAEYECYTAMLVENEQLSIIDAGEE